MSIKASGYILNVPKNRRETLLDELHHGGGYFHSVPIVAEPVPLFDHSRRAPLVVFIAFESKKITHIAYGRKGVSAGTGLVRLNLLDVEVLSKPIGFTKLKNGVSKKIQPHLDRVLRNGGILPPKTLAEFVQRIIELDPSISSRLARYSKQRKEAIARLKPEETENLAYQKEALGMALDIAGLPKDELLEWSPVEDAPQQSFLDGLPGAQVREDAMLLADFSTVPGFDSDMGATHYGSKTFWNELDSSIRLTVIMANRLPLEQQTGADLIYFNEKFQAFVMVQYKAMEHVNGEAEFRWQAKGQFTDEIKRMDKLLVKLNRIKSGNHPNGFRFSNNPFFLKFCPRVVLNPDDKGLFKGIYLPLELWKRADKSGHLKGPQGGNVLTFKNVGRRINNTEFVNLVSGAWVGTSIEQSTVLADLIREVLSSGKTVTFAVKHAVEVDSIDT